MSSSSNGIIGPKLIPTELFQQIHKILPIACVDVVLQKNNTFLLAKRKNKPAQGKWYMAGGRILKNETLEAAALRKVKQETGIDAKIEKMIGVDETIFADGPFDDSTHTINVVFLATPIDGNTDISLDDQNDEYQWFTHISNSWDPYVQKFLTLAGFTYNNQDA